MRKAYRLAIKIDANHTSGVINGIKVATTLISRNAINNPPPDYFFIKYLGKRELGWKVADMTKLGFDLFVLRNGSLFLDGIDSGEGAPSRQMLLTNKLLQDPIAFVKYMKRHDGYCDVFNLVTLSKMKDSLSNFIKLNSLY